MAKRKLKILRHLNIFLSISSEMAKEKKSKSKKDDKKKGAGGGGNSKSKQIRVITETEVLKGCSAMSSLSMKEYLGDTETVVALYELRSKASKSSIIVRPLTYYPNSQLGLFASIEIPSKTLISKKTFPMKDIRIFHPADVIQASRSKVCVSTVPQ